jgi:hypothetical protein
MLGVFITAQFGVVSYDTERERRGGINTFLHTTAKGAWRIFRVE